MYEVIGFIVIGIFSAFVLYKIYKRLTREDRPISTGGGSRGKWPPGPE